MRSLDKSLIDELDYHFDKLFNPYGNSEVCYDGIVDFEKYNESPIRIMWVLKETNDEDGGGWDLRKFVQSNLISNTETNTRYKYWQSTFSPMIYTTWGILNDFADWKSIPDIEDGYEDEMIDILKNTAIVNLKKFPGGSTTDHIKLEEFYNLHKELFLKQVELFKPDIIIGAGALKVFGSDIGVNWEEYEEKDYSISNGKVILGTYHPAQTQKTKEKYVSDLIRKAKLGLEELKK